MNAFKINLADYNNDFLPRQFTEWWKHSNDIAAGLRSIGETPHAIHDTGNTHFWVDTESGFRVYLSGWVCPRGY